MTYVLLGVIVLLCCAILHAHRRHADVLDEIRGELAVALRKLRKAGSDTPPGPE